jgi:amidase
MTFKLPSTDQVRSLGDSLGMEVTDDYAKSFIDFIKPFGDGYRLLASLPDDVPVVKYPRGGYYRPEGEDNKYGAWIAKTSIKGASTGKLAGKKVAVKDTYALAGVPLTNGASVLEGFVPEFDAPVITRLLDAGAEIVGKTHCECFCLSGGSHTNATGPVHNPWKMGYSAGGSSSGSAVVVALKEADMAIGGDQGGSIRMPASFSGIYGMKPTWGLVPYTGIMPIEIFIDHTGPMTGSVSDNALMLEVIAGDDGYDPRIKAPKVPRYSELLAGGVKGMKIGIVREGFEQATAEAAVSEKVRAAAKRLADLGAQVTEVSIPMHLVGPALWTPIGAEGLTQTMMWGDGYGLSRQDLYSVALMDFHRGWRKRADELSETTKLLIMLGTHMNNAYGSRYYGKAVNITRRLTAAYDQVLQDHDLLLMPTTPMKATPLPGPGASREEYVNRALEMIGNTAPFDLTHHPAMSLPCGMVDGLPVGLMLVGKHFDEPTIYRAAYAFEQSGDWKGM